MQDFGQKLKQKRKSLRLTAEELGRSLNIKPNNIYKWESGTTPSNPEEFNKIMAWLGESERFPINQGNVLETSQTDYKEKYIKNLEEQTKFLQRMLESSLGSIAEVQMAQLSHQKALAWYQAYNQAGRDPNRTLDELATLNSKVAEYAGLKLEKDTVTNT